MTCVLFVCTANICRSPSAEYLFRDQVAQAGEQDHWWMTSAGTWARPGLPVDRTVRELLAERGIDARDHRSQEVNERLLAQANIVLVMERGHREALRVEFPHHAPKIYLLSELKDQEQDILDPFGGPRVEYQSTLEEIEQFLSDSEPKIRSLSTA